MICNFNVYLCNMKILSASEMRQLDAHNISECGVCSIQLMEQASLAFVDEFSRCFGAKRRVVVFCGSGNNGGDGLAVARLLSGKGYAVAVYLFSLHNKLSADCETNKNRLGECASVEFHEITSQFEPPVLTADSVIVDALFGTGLNRPLTGGFAQLVEFINASEAKTVSIDMPSGLMDVEDAAKHGIATAVRANYTFTFHCLKPCMLLADSQQYLGEVRVLDIGLDDSHLDYSQMPYTAIDVAAVRALLKSRDPFSHKGTCGHGLLMAGSYGMAGAAILSAKAALRGGVGKLTVHTPQRNVVVMQTAVPEAVLSIDGDEDTISCETIGVADFAAVAFGPGVGKSRLAKKSLLSILRQRPERLVVDADGLNLLAEYADWHTMLPANTIISPHRKEWERLLGRTANDATLLMTAREYATKYHIIIIVKGHHTAVCLPNGKICFNTSGNSGMATAGSGDVLTGLLLSLRSQGYEAEDAALMATWIHGKAGDLAAEALSEWSVVASDIVDALPRVFKLLNKN